jgi:hypothetical protein
VAPGVQDEVVQVRPVREVLAGVVDDLVGAEGADQVDLRSDTSTAARYCASREFSVTCS